METLWVTFRIHDDSGYDERYESVTNTILRNVSGEYWVDSTSFYLLQTGATMYQLTSAISRVISKRDVVLVGSMDTKGAVLAGSTSDLSSLQTIVPGLQTA